MANEKTYIQLKSKEGVFAPRGHRNIKFVNRTVIAFDGDLPAAIEDGLSKNRLAKVDKKEFDKWTKEHNAETAKGKAAIAARSEKKTEPAKPAKKEKTEDVVDPKELEKAQEIIDEAIEAGVLENNKGWIKHGENAIGRTTEAAGTLVKNPELAQSIQTETVTANESAKFNKHVQDGDEWSEKITDAMKESGESSEADKAIESYKKALEISEDEDVQEKLDDLMEVFAS